MKKTLLTFLKWIPSFIIFSISFYLSSQSTIEQMPTFSYADKIVHFICFGGLAFWVAFGCNSSENKKIKILLPTIIVSIYGIIDEFHQSFTPGRDATISDWIADTLGALFGSFVFYLVVKIIKKIKDKKTNTK